MEDDQQSGNLQASRRVRFSVGILTIALLSGMGFGICKWIHVVRPWLDHITVGYCVLGSVCFIARWVSLLSADTEDKVLHFYQNPGYWGLCLLVAAGVTFSAVSILDPQPMVVHARVEQAPAAPEVEFPELKISGVVLNGARSSAVIAGHPVYSGEFVKGVQVVHIFEDGVVVENGGVRRVYYRKTTHAEFVDANEAIAAGQPPNWFSQPTPRPQKAVAAILPAE